MYFFYKNLIHKLLSSIKTGKIILQEAGKEYVFGNSQNSPIQLEIIDPNTYKMILFHGSVGAGNAYMQGYWRCNELSKLIKLILENKQTFKQIDGLFTKIHYKLNQIAYLLKPNNIKYAKQNILKHYDLSNEFFELFLDEKLMYSSAIFKHPRQSIDEASTYKLHVICEKLKLSSHDHILEIGTGWGGFAVYAAQNYGCKVTTTTISDKQYEYACNLITQLKLGNHICVLQKDYRELDGCYDKIVSIEMIEAVGFQYYKNFFTALNKLLKPEGLLLLQAIVINDKDYERAKLEVDFIKKFIFPGGCLPSIAMIQKHISEDTSLQPIEIEEIGTHYCKTLECWDKKLRENKNKILSLGFSENFYNMWKFYFAYCDAGFNQKHINNIHGLWIKK